MPIALHFSHYPTHSIKPHDSHTLTGNLSSYRLMSDTRPPPRSLTCLYLKPSNAVSLELRSFVSSQVTSSVGSSLSSLQFSQWNLTRRHVEVLNVFVSVTVILGACTILVDSLSSTGIHADTSICWCNHAESGNEEERMEAKILDVFAD
ncbi:hypothetical protein CK203_055485 [Vitis vinifera]|uniref:Uncharacterized protein n=1 Tax=Vitis vinifera TaxID=29760 RepID=A0A438FKS6_VITVI|nr:hypothetical protein CK203_055485 [Vitis vinifera]